MKRVNSPSFLCYTLQNMLSERDKLGLLLQQKLDEVKEQKTK